MGWPLRSGPGPHPRHERCKASLMPMRFQNPSAPILGQRRDKRIPVFSVCWVLVVTTLTITGLTQNASGQATFVRNRCVTVNVAYEDVLERLSGESASRQLFASQDVQLRAYMPRDNSSPPNQNGALQATIDIVGWSCEYGRMPFTMDIFATDTQTTISVALDHAVDRVLRQVYEFAITPLNTDTTKICIRHTLCVRVTKRSLPVVNELIRQVTYKKSNQIIDQLTPRMAQRVVTVASHNPAEADDVAPSPASQDAPRTASPSPTSRSESLTLSTPPAKIVPNSNTAMKLKERVPMEETTVEPAQPIEPPNNIQPTATTKRAEIEANLLQKPTVPSLRVTITGAQGTSGQMHVSIFNSQSQYKNCDVRRAPAKQGAMFRQKSVPVTPDNAAAVTVVFDDLPPGNYGVVGFHDIDGNRQLNANFLGQPSEPYGFSKDARNPLRPPDFEKIRIPFNDEDREVRFHVK